MDAVELINQSLEDSLAVKKNFVALNRRRLQDAANAICDCFSKGGKVLIAGNGGSAADSVHFAAELVGRYKNDRSPLPAISLAADIANLTAISNDYSYAKVFERQVSALGNDGDVFVAISTSGNSANIVAAAKEAKRRGIKVIGLIGKPACELAPYCNIVLAARRGESSGRIQESHIFGIHVLVELIELKLNEKEGLK